MRNPVRIQSLLELQQLDGYRQRVNPATEPLKDVFGTTNFSQLVQCGLTTCGQWHYYGVVVELEHGGVTNVGHICGRQFGHALFDGKLSEFQERRLRPQVLATLAAGRQSVYAKARELDSQTQRLRDLIAWRIGFNRCFPQLHNAITRRAHQGEATINDVIERTPAEIEELLALTPGRPREAFRYQEITRGKLAGLSFITADIASVLADLGIRREEFYALESLHSLHIDKLLQWERWCHSLPARVAEASRLIEAAAAFFAPSNVSLFTLIATNPVERAGLTGRKAEDLAIEKQSPVMAEQGQRRKGWAR